MMNRKFIWRAIAVLAVLGVLTAVLVNENRQAERSRAVGNRAATEAALRRFSEAVPLGSTRRQVKEALARRGVSFSQRCCFEPNGPFSVIVRVGQEDKPWYCSEWPVYVAFEFSSVEAPRRATDILESDVLKLVHLTSNGEGCL
jgi:hypothetical protein